MKGSVKDLTRGNLWKQIVVFSLPLMASNLLQVLFHMADTAVAGNFAGGEALGAVGSTTTLITFFTWFVVGLSVGVNALVALNIGAKDKEALEKSIHSAAIISVAMGILLLLVGFIFSRPVLELLGTKEELMEGAVVYFRIYMLGMPGAAIYNFGNAVLSAAGDTKRPLIYLSVSGGVNVLLNLFLVIVCRMGVAGVGIATTVSLYLSAALILSALIRSKEDIRVSVRKLRLDGYAAKRILVVGVTTGFQYSLFSIANMFIQSGINSFDTSVVQGNAVAVSMDNFTYEGLNSLYAATTSFVGQNLGAGKKKRILHSYLICQLYAFGFSIFMCILFLLFGRQILTLFTPEAAIIEEAFFRLRILSLTMGAATLMDCAVSASRGLGKTVWPTVFVGFGICAFRVLWMLTVFPYFRTLTVLYLLYLFSWAVTAAMEIPYFFHCYKKIPGESVPKEV